MKAKFYRITTISLCFGFFVFLIGQQKVNAQQEKHLSFNDVISKLTFTSRINKTTQEINEQLISDIQKRGVNFILDSDDEESLKKAGANDSLIRTIKKNLPKEIKEKLVSVKEKESLYKKFTDNYAGTLEQKKIALEAAKEFVKRYSNDEDIKVLIDYFVKAIPQLEKIIDCCEPDIRNKYYEKFNNSLKTNKWDDLFEAGAEILRSEPDFVDVMLVLASVGFNSATEESNQKYLDQTLYYAEKSIEVLEKNERSRTNLYGVYQYSYKTKDFSDGKANALGHMNYIIGYIRYFYLNQKDEAISYFQKSLNYKSQSNELVRKLRLLP